MRALAQELLRRLGKSDHRIIAVFGASGAAWREAVKYVRSEAPQFPVWLFLTGSARAARDVDCERVFELPAGAMLPLRIARILWPHWVALSVVTYTAEPGFRWLKLAPFLAPPWKLLVMNEQGDFFAGWPFGLIVHGWRRARDRMATAAVSAKDLLLAIFWKAAWTLGDPFLKLTPRPWLRPHEPPALGSPTASAGEAWIVLGAGGSPGDVAPLRSLLERPDTFAAAFQSGRAGFQKDVIARAPFRQLQPGEVSAVLAPEAETVLVSADKLARLGGLPHARSRRCQYLLLCWKAACAGWKSYSVGVEAPRIPMIRDRAFPEAEFCFRLLRERPRPRAAPGSFDALRGSIATDPRHHQPLRAGRRRILVVSPYLPFPLSHGGAVRIFNLSRHLSSQYDLFLIAFRERGDRIDYERLACCFRRVWVVDHDERVSRDPSVPGPVAQFRSRAMTAAIREAAAGLRPDLLQIEYTQLAEYRRVLPETPAVLVEHDVTFSLYEQLPDRREYELWRRYEGFWLRRYDAVAVMSRPERDKAVGAGAPEGRTWVVPNGVDLERFRPQPEPAGPPELLFVGSFRHLPNLLAFEHLQSEILPRLWRRRPDVRVRVVAGPEYQKYWRGTPDPRIAVEGFLADLAPCYARAAAVLVPLPVSAGTNIKVMEALACGRPVVSTPAGCAGLDLAEGEEVLVAAAPDAFADAVQRLLDDAGLRRRLGERGRRAAEERFGWERCARRAIEMYESVWTPAAGPGGREQRESGSRAASASWAPG